VREIDDHLLRLLLDDVIQRLAELVQDREHDESRDRPAGTRVAVV